MASVVELVQALQRGTRELTDALTELQERAIERVDADSDYEYAWSVAYLKTDERNQKGREAQTFLADDVMDLKHKAKMSEALEKSASKAVDAHRTVLSAIQSIAKLSAAEAELYGKGPM